MPRVPNQFGRVPRRYWPAIQRVRPGPLALCLYENPAAIASCDLHPACGHAKKPCHLVGSTGRRECRERTPIGRDQVSRLERVHESCVDFDRRCKPCNWFPSGASPAWVRDAVLQTGRSARRFSSPWSRRSCHRSAAEHSAPDARHTLLALPAVAKV